MPILYMCHQYFFILFMFSWDFKHLFRQSFKLTWLSCSWKKNSMNFLRDMCQTFTTVEFIEFSKRCFQTFTKFCWILNYGIHWILWVICFQTFTTVELSEFSTVEFSKFSEWYFSDTYSQLLNSVNSLCSIFQTFTTVTVKFSEFSMRYVSDIHNCCRRSSSLTDGLLSTVVDKCNCCGIACQM